MSKYNPDHYQGTIEPWDFIAAQELNFFEGNIIKYITRAGKKENESRLDDLIKAQHYLRKLIEIEATNDSRTRLTRTSNQVPSSDGTADRDVYPVYLTAPTPSDYRGVQRVV